MKMTTKKTLKAGLRIFEFSLLVLLVMTMIELMLMYKDAHDNPEDYVENRPRPTAPAPTNAASAQPAAMAPGQPAPGMRPQRNPVRPRQPGRGQGARPAQPAPGGSGGNGDVPSVFNFVRIRNQMSVFFVDSPTESSDSDRMTNEPPAELTTTNAMRTNGTMASDVGRPNGNRQVSFAATRTIRPSARSAARSTNGAPAFRFAIP